MVFEEHIDPRHHRSDCAKLRERHGKVADLFLGLHGGSSLVFERVCQTSLVKVSRLVQWYHE